MDGLICINKPQGITSFDVCAIMRRLLSEKRVGHAGTLDPMATGVLPIFLGRATKVIDLLPINKKRYIATLQVGIKTDTGDITGEIVAQSAVRTSRMEVESILQRFCGETEQTPPMYSALKHNGVRLYDLARQGIEVERSARKIHIYEINLIDSNELENQYTIDVLCSKGTYIRSLCEDIGSVLGCEATMSALCRTMSSGFMLQDSISIDEANRLAQENLLENKIQDVECVFNIHPEVLVTENQAVRFLNGGALSVTRIDDCPINGLCRVKSKQGNFLGLGIIDVESEELKSQYIVLPKL
jgi:tRNA pseudouridine55 synthase